MSSGQTIENHNFKIMGASAVSNLDKPQEFSFADDFEISNFESKNVEIGFLDQNFFGFDDFELLKKIDLDFEK